MEEEKSEIVVAQKTEIIPSKLMVKYVNGEMWPESLDEMFRVAQCIWQSGIYPKGCDTPQKIILAIQAGKEVGFKICQSLKNIAVIGGKPSIYADGIPALVLSKNLLTVFDEKIEGKPFSDDWTAVCRIQRRGLTPQELGLERIERFSWADAKQARLDTKPGPWKDYPKKMLMYRARAYAFRALFADVLCGLNVYEEVRDYSQPEFVKASDDLILEGK